MSEDGSDLRDHHQQFMRACNSCGVPRIHVQRDGRHWRVQRTGLLPVLVFASKDDLFSVVFDFNNGLEDRSDAELQRLLDEGRGGERHEPDTSLDTSSILYSSRTMALDQPHDTSEPH